MTSQDFLAVIQKDTDRINDQLRANLESHVGLIHQVGEHILLGGGKRIRPMLFLLCSRLAGYGGESQYRYSSLFEYLHAASLLHDDVIDHAETRRGKSAANVVWGNSAAVLVGDFLHSKSFQLALETGNMRILHVLSKTTNRMAEGMILELIHSFNFDLTMDQYMEVIVSKTAVLMSAACRVGAIMGEIAEEWENALESFGLELGIAFQIVDDALDYSLTEQEFGKPVGKDLDEGKVTLPLLHTLHSCTQEERKRIVAMCGRHSYKPEHFPEVLEIVRRYQGVEYSMERAKEHVDRARRYLDTFPDNEERRMLFDLADFVIERRF